MRKTKYTKEIIEEAVKNSQSLAGVIKVLNLKPTGGNYTYFKKIISFYDISIEHFTGQGWNKGLTFNPNPSVRTEDLLVENSSYQSPKLRLRLLNEGYKEYKCEHCGLTEWLGMPIPLELHHINGIHTDNRIENLEVLCSNCHSLTENFSKIAPS